MEDAGGGESVDSVDRAGGAVAGGVDRRSFDSGEGPLPGLGGGTDVWGGSGIVPGAEDAVALAGDEGCGVAGMISTASGERGRGAVAGVGPTAAPAAWFDRAVDGPASLKTSGTPDIVGSGAVEAATTDFRGGRGGGGEAVTPARSDAMSGDATRT